MGNACCGPTDEQKAANEADSRAESADARQKAAAAAEARMTATQSRGTKPGADERAAKRSA
jgi:hypothetical protein